MRATDHFAGGSVRCFLLTDARIADGHPRSVVIEKISGRCLTARLAQPPQPGSLVQFNLGNFGWADAKIKWASGTQMGAELHCEIDLNALLGEHAPGAASIPGDTATWRVQRSFSQ